MTDLQNTSLEVWLDSATVVVSEADAFFDNPTSYKTADISQLLTSLIALMSCPVFSDMPTENKVDMEKVKVSLVLALAERYTHAKEKPIVAIIDDE